MDDYLSKPLRMKELAAALDKWLPLNHASLPAWSAATLTELVGDNPGMHKRLLGKFLVNATVQVTDITAAAAASDTATLAGIAHTLKSAARSVGALALGELCQRLETAGRTGDANACSELAAGLQSEFAAASTAISGHLGL
jgi:HPt (histidine-containing phosphotransfer) domain-containing protein